MKTVRIGTDKGRLRLEWSYNSKRYYLYPNLEDTITNRRKIIQSNFFLELIADLKEDKFDESLKKYKAIINPSITIINLLKGWIESKKCLPQTKAKYIGLIKDCESFWGHEKLSDTLSKKECESFIEWLEKKKQKVGNRKLSSLKVCWDWGIQQGLISSNPWKNSQISIIPSRRPEPFTRVEVIKILNRFKQSHPDWFFFVDFLFKTGLRLSEAIGLKWGDISNDKLTINRQLVAGLEKRPKTGIRSFTLSKSLSEDLHRRKENENEFVFKINNKPIDLQYFRKSIWAPILQKEGILYRRPYTCRHTFISHSLENGINPVNLAHITGHDPSTLFKFYAGVIAPPTLPDLY